MNNKMNGILLACAITISGTADSAIIYTADKRYIYTYQYSTFFPSSPYTDINFRLDTDHTSIYQNSTFNSTGISGEGSGSVNYDGPGPYGVEAESFFYVSFIVDESTNFTLNGNLSTYDIENSKVFVRLLEGEQNIFQLDSSSSLFDTSTPFSFNSQFTEGNTYTLSLFAGSDAYFDNTESWSFDLTTTPVPLPAAAWLFISGLLGLACTATRRHKPI